MTDSELPAVVPLGDGECIVKEGDRWHTRKYDRLIHIFDKHASHSIDCALKASDAPARDDERERIGLALYAQGHHTIAGQVLASLSRPVNWDRFRAPVVVGLDVGDLQDRVVKRIVNFCDKEEKHDT